MRRRVIVSNESISPRFRVWKCEGATALSTPLGVYQREDRIARHAPGNTVGQGSSG
jgi:hypothetical protein